mmetsp:Transcript_21597/g.27928  ORF Transcript_21597/g.27928 Transcript_21597/m.27928 type:complete len:381 (+) Transcript_21597:154-1296(+)
MKSNNHHLLSFSIFFLACATAPQIAFSFPSFRSVLGGCRQEKLSPETKMSGTTIPSYDERQVELDSGISMKVTLGLGGGASNKRSKTTKKKPVLVFLHGSFHGGWCWTEKFFAHYIDEGYSVIAPCWRGTGGTFAGESVEKVQIQQHVEDLKVLLNKLPSLLSNTTKDDDDVKPVLIAHSFGSLAVMKLLELHPEYNQQISGIVMMCGVPPSGNGKMTMRFLRRSLVASYKITVGFAMKKCLTDTSLCRDLFFGGPVIVDDHGGAIVDDHGVSDEDVLRYQQYFTRDSKATIDLFDLAKQLPSAVTVEGGKSPFYRELPTARMVLGARQDFIVDKEGVEETARYFDVDLPSFVDSPHDVMLGSQWTHAAHELDIFLQKNF